MEENKIFEEGSSQPAPAGQGSAETKAKRTRRTKAEMAEDEKRRHDEEKQKLLEELRQEGLLRGSDDDADADSLTKNLGIWDKVRRCPEHALKPITSGQNKGLTDINPVWREKVLTALFGPAGIGWYYSTKHAEVVDVASYHEFRVLIELYVKTPSGKWSAPIEGHGGAALLRADGAIDTDAFKKATTDALSYACKHLGIAADIYFSADADKPRAPFDTKYDTGVVNDNAPEVKAAPVETPEVKVEQKPVQVTIVPPAPAEPAPKVTEKKTEPAPAPKVETPSGGLFSNASKPQLVANSSEWFTIVTRLATIRSGIKLEQVAETIDEVRKNFLNWDKMEITPEQLNAMMVDAGFPKELL